MSDVAVLKGGARFTLEEIRRAVVTACQRAGAGFALLFGSYGRGTADAWSDVDLIFVLETQQAFLERYRAFEDVLDALPGAELLVYTPAEFRELRARSGFLERALSEGIVLHGEEPR